MKHPLFFALALIALATPLQAMDPFRVSGTTNDGGLRVRSEPTLEGEMVASLPNNADLEILDLTSDTMSIGDMKARWYKVRTLSESMEVEGWAYGYFIEAQQSDLLALAIWLGSADLVRDLIAEGADVGAILSEEGLVFTEYDEYEYKSAPIIEAIRAGREDFVQILLASGTDPDAILRFGGPGGGMNSSALIEAVDLGDFNSVELLVEHGADLEIEGYEGGAGADRYKRTALSAAIISRNATIATYLLESGADLSHSLEYTPMSGDKYRMSPLDIAMMTNFTDIEELIRSMGGERAN